MRQEEGHPGGGGEERGREVNPLPLPERLLPTR